MKILFVDDDPNVLSGYQRQLRKHFTVDIALGGIEALECLQKNGPYAVVIADMQMPQMNGVQLLQKVHALAPDTVRMMLTGKADQQTVIEAINEGQIFRFLNKPCPPDTMVRALAAALEQYRLLTSEKELLEKTLLGSVNILTEMLAMVDPLSLGRARKLRDYARAVAGPVGYPNVWELELSSLLSQIGHLTMPGEILAKEHQGIALTPEEAEMVGRIPEIGYNLLRKIPRLETVAKIIRYASKHYNGAGMPQDATTRQDIPMGSRILKILGDVVDIERTDTPRTVALRLLRNRNGWYDTQILDSIVNHFCPQLTTLTPLDRQGAQAARKISADDMHALKSKSPDEPPSLPLAFKDLLVGDTLVMDAVALDGSLLLSAHNTVTEPILARLKNYADLKGIQEPVYVAVSDDEEIKEAA